MILLFLLSTIHIALAYTWAFITDRAQTGIYELFSLDNPLPVLYGPDDPAIVRRLGILIKIRYTLANAIADGIIVYRCYVIWGSNWRPVVFPAFSYACTLIGGILGIIPLSGTSERVATAACMATIFCTNVLAASLAGEEIIRTNLVHFSSNCQASEKKIAKEIYGFDSYYGIAPTLIIVRVGLGVSTEDVDQSTLGGTTDQRGAITTMEFQVRAMGEEFRESLSDPKVG
ncbi:hypothetical protein B0H14DRAFT_2559431 [Mycena olivaceomarginata]|nr:hypothetical protein B0H14DRAFT_2574920 [Mycena olivaceomarginata]KAJ7894307.1 hypothetical protein B0H14DRAFT_2559431 [Mycena olivaceomarginata]